MKKKISLTLMALLYILAGINHFVHPFFYVDVVPHYIPMPALMVSISGVCEFVFGMFLFPAITRKVAAWLIILMLIVFFTVHVQMIIDNYPAKGRSFWIAVIRFPLQFVLIYWAYKVSQYRGRFADLP